MLICFDHAIFLVADPSALDTVAARFTAAGFTITERPDRGRDKAATAQKLICFDDGSYVEILTVRDQEARARHRFAHLFPQGDGWADYSVYTDALEALRCRLAAANMPIAGPFDHSKELDDGRAWGVSLILAGIGAGHPALPFLLQDIVGRDLRIPRHLTRHDNGIAGIAGVTVGVRDLGAVAPHFTVLFGPGVSLRHAPAGSTRGMRFCFGRQWVEVLEVAPAPSGLAEHVARRGEGVVSVTFVLPGGDDRGAREGDLCYSAARLLKDD